jgi:RNA polymerase sigma-70 factor (ECF subfamily)
LSKSKHQELLEQALNGNGESLGDLLEVYRAYLTVLAKRDLNDRIKCRIDENDIVQVTFLEAQRDFKQFRGTTLEELLAWLRNILRNNVSSAHQRHLYTQKRSAGRETSSNVADSGPGLTELVPAETSSPSKQLMREEAAVYLTKCLEDLPDTQQQALRMRYVEGLSLKEIAERMDKSEMAAAGLLKRGLQALRQRMITDSSDTGFPV